MPIHETLPLLLAAPTAAVSLASGIYGFRTSWNAKTSKGDLAAEQAKTNREARHQAARDSMRPND